MNDQDLSLIQNLDKNGLTGYGKSREQCSIVFVPTNLFAAFENL